MKNNIVKLIVIFTLLFPMIGETIEFIIGINSLDYDLALSQGINNNDSYGFITPIC